MGQLPILRQGSEEMGKKAYIKGSCLIHSASIPI